MKQLLSALALLLVGCGGQTLNVGDDGASMRNPNTGSLNDAGLPESLQAQPICNDPVVNAPDANWPNPLACAASATGDQSNVVGVWEGYTEDANFNPIAPYRLELLAAAPGGAICGTIKYGTGAPPPLSSDPTVFYPPLDTGYYPDYPAQTPPFSGSPAYWGMLNGATYTIVSGGMADNQVRFQVSAFEHYKGWCGLQSAYRVPTTAGELYGCSPIISGAADSGNWGTDSPDFCHMTIDGVSFDLPGAQCQNCGAFGSPVCACDSCHCTALLSTSHGFELTFNGDQATGTTGAYNGPSMPLAVPASIRLKRVQP